MTTLQKNYKLLKGINKRTLLCCKENDLPTIIGSKPQKQKKRILDLILMSEVEEILGNKEQYGIDRKLDLTNLDKEVEHQEVGYHLKHQVHIEAHGEHLQENFQKSSHSSS